MLTSNELYRTSKAWKDGGTLFELYSQYASTRPPNSVFLKKFSVTLSGSGGGSAGLSCAAAWGTVASESTHAARPAAAIARRLLRESPGIKAITSHLRAAAGEGREAEKRREG